MSCSTVQKAILIDSHLRQSLGHKSFYTVFKRKNRIAVKGEGEGEGVSS